MATMFIHHISELNADDEDITLMVRSTFSALKERDIAIPIHVTTHAASILVSRGQHRRAINLWETLSSHQGIPSTAMDLVTLTVFLKAYIGLRDSVGIDWVAKMLLVNDLVPDKRFKILLKNSRQDARKVLDRNPYSDEALRFHGVLDNALQKVVALRAERMEGQRYAKAMTLEIMEKAAKAEGRQRSTNSAPVITNHSTELGKWGRRIGASTGDYNEGSQVALAESDNEPYYGLSVPRERLIGVAAG
jgi:hypothetical protein